jgi:hypothetical protein
VRALVVARSSDEKADSSDTSVERPSPTVTGVTGTPEAASVLSRFYEGSSILTSNRHHGEEDRMPAGGHDPVLTRVLGAAKAAESAALIISP